MNFGEPGHGEIIIIKRSGTEEEGHHGGAWKIAFADFMTAMMALFLVLWLINAANEETKRAVASYFNPVKLVDRNRSVKGVNDQQAGPTSEPAQSDNAQSKRVAVEQEPPLENGPASDDPDAKESAFFASPMEQIDSILLASQEQSHLTEANISSNGEASIEIFADPFAPAAPQTTPTSQSKSEQIASASRENKAVSEKSGAGETEETEASALVANETKSESEKASLLKSEIQKAILESGGLAATFESAIEVKSVPEGFLISVTDQLDKPMFNVGSAIPESSLVLAMDAIATSLASRPGPIHVYGHTDAREYKKNKLGNWKLSTDRAQSTYFMLLHGGLEERRIQKIAGFADRKLRDLDDPFSASNRRIEILLANP